VTGARARTAVSTSVQTVSPLDLVLTTDADPVQVGDDLEYALRFGLSGAASLLGTQLVLTLPAGTSVVDAGGGTVGANTITWAIGTLDPAVTGERRARVHVDTLAPDEPLVRVARAVVTSGTAAARASVVTQVQATPLGVEMVAEPDPVAPAGLVLYRLTAVNRGVDDAVQAELRLTLPVGVFACATPSDGGTAPDNCLPDRDVVWALGTLGAGEARSVQLAIQIRGDTPTGTILSTTARIEDVAGARARTALSTAVQTASPLGLVLTTDADPTQVGDTLEYALRFGNRGATSLVGAQLVLTLPAGTSVVDAGGGTAAGGTITWSLGTLAPAATGERLVQVHVNTLAPDEPLVRVARAVITSGTAEAREGVVTQVQPAAFALGIAATPDPVAPAGLETYQLIVANHGAGDAVQVELRMTLPVGVFACNTLSDGGTTPDSCLADRDVVWSLGTMGAGTMRTVQAVVQIRGDAPSGTILSTSARVADVSGSRTRAGVSVAVVK
jgi:uncharacterized repeat protein (TIGR01451 family)